MPRSTPAPGPASRWPRPRTLAIAVLALALILRLWDCTARSLWMDEAVEYWAAAAPLGDLFATVRSTIQDPPLYSLLLHFWMTLSHHEAWLRALSLLFGMGSVLGVMVIGHRLQGWTSAIAAGLLMAILPTAINYSQEAGQYAAMTCALTWSMVALLALDRDPSWRNFARWGLLAAASVYTYYGTIITLAVTFGAFMIESARRKNRAVVKRGVWTVLAFVIAVLPLVLYFIPEQLRRGPTTRAFEMQPGASFGVVLEHVGVFLERTFAFQFTGWPCTPVPGWLTVAVIIVLFVLVMRLQRRMATWLASTWVVYSVIGLFNLFPFGFRYSLILVPMVVPLLACAARIQDFTGLRRIAAIASLGYIVVICVISLPNRSWYDRVHGDRVCLWPETEDVRKVAEYWHQRRTPDQPTYVYYAAVPSFAYYADQLASDTPERPAAWYLDCWRDTGAPWCRIDNVFYARTVRAMDNPKKVASMFETMVGMPDQFWWITAHSQVGEVAALTRILHEQYEIGDVIMGTYATGALLRRRAPAGTPPIEP